MNTSNNADDVMKENVPTHVQMVIQDAVENLRFAKRQQWKITNYPLIGLI